MKTLEQERMKKAYEFVSNVKENYKEIRSEYSSLAKKLPSMIVHNGLITTIVFLRSKAGRRKDGRGGNNITPHGKLLEQLLSYLKDRSLIESEEYESFINKTENMEIEEYMFITQDVLAFATWLKRIAEGEIEDEGT